MTLWSHPVLIPTRRVFLYVYARIKRTYERKKKHTRTTYPPERGRWYFFEVLSRLKLFDLHLFTLVIFMDRFIYSCCQNAGPCGTLHRLGRGEGHLATGRLAPTSVREGYSHQSVTSSAKSKRADATAFT